MIDHTGIAVTAGVANAGLSRPPGAQTDRQAQSLRARRGRAAAGVVRTGVVDDEHVAAQRRPHAGHDLADTRAFVASRDDRQTVGRTEMKGSRGQSECERGGSRFSRAASVRSTAAKAERGGYPQWAVRPAPIAEERKRGRRVLSGSGQL